jgi:hypothetical protein
MVAKRGSRKHKAWNNKEKGHKKKEWLRSLDRKRKKVLQRELRPEDHNQR